MIIAATGAARAYETQKIATGATPEKGSSLLADGARSFAETLHAGEVAAQAALQGRGDSHQLVEALAQSELAVETVVTVRNKVVEAYQEILRMPV